jgi:acyl-CoA reductase-like NAD-dependent aldehyde dehydrogenase
MSELNCVNPFSGESTGIFKLESFEEQKKKVTLLKETQKRWKNLDLKERLVLIKTGLSYFDKNRTEIAKDISEQMGRPLHYCEGEVNGFFERANYLCEISTETLSPDILNDKEGFDRSIEHAPLGTIFVIAAWNFPLLITVNSIIPALLAGNTVLLKHSGQTPKIGKHFENAFNKLGSFSNLIFNSILDHKTTGQVIEELAIDHVIFTGSVNGGKQILNHTSKRFMTPGLELGGKDAAYIHHDADIDYAVETIVDGCMFNSGQSCCGIERVYAHESIREEFLEKAEKLISEYKAGDPNESSTTLGPLAQAKAADFMEAQIKDAKNKGAKVLVGGDIQKISKGTFFQATLLSDATHEMEVMKEENFGPILPVMQVVNIQEAIDLINDSEYGLTCAVFTKDTSVASEIADQVDTGTVFMNRCDYLDPALPWTGVKNSGCGSSLSKYGFYGVTRRKAIHFKTKL